MIISKKKTEKRKKRMRKKCKKFLMELVKVFYKRILFQNCFIKINITLKN
jgi:hypothetical protein